MISGYLRSCYRCPIFDAHSGCFRSSFRRQRWTWHHLFETVLPRYVLNTLVLMLGVTVVTLLFESLGPDRSAVRLWDVIVTGMLLLPAAVPAYLIAYTYTDFSNMLDHSGACCASYSNTRVHVITGSRRLFHPGAILVMGSVLYPYIAADGSIAFQITPATLYEVGRLSRRACFGRLLPFSR